jgi:RNA polymerase sigma factor (sigma-70 family)
MNASESFDDLMPRLRAGDPRAATQVFERFAGRLIGLAHQRLGQVLQGKVDPEDVVQSALKSFFRRTDRPFEFRDWNDLWALLAQMTLWKCGHRIRYFRAARRDAGREVSSSLEEDRDSWQALAREPDPSEAAMLAETVEGVLRTLNERDRRVLVLSLQGNTVAEIGEAISCTERTVYRTLEFIRSELTAMHGD